MGLFNKGLPWLSCFAAPRAQRLLSEQEYADATPWHQQPDIVSLVLARLPTAEVLPKERVCRAWKDARVMLQTEVHLKVSKKLCKWQHAWLKHNIDRIGGALTVQGALGPDGKSTTSCHASSRSAYEILAIAVTAKYASRLILSNFSSICSLPADSFSSQQQLQQLHLTNCSGLRSFPESLGNLSALQLLSITACSSLVSLPNRLGRLTSLKQLNITDCDALSSIPVSLGGLHSLQQFDLRGCMQLQQLPESLGCLVSLQTLHIQFCGLKAVPSTVGRLQLKALKLTHCPNLQELPDSVSQLQQLQHLELQLPLRHLPSISQLSKLQHLLLGCLTDEVTSITHHIGQLSHLESLTLVGWSGLQQLPDGLGDLEALTQLGLKDCGQLMALPASVGRLRSLKRLVLQGCGLICLPESLGDMESLASLIIHSCDIRDLPSSIGKLSALQQFILVDCPRLRYLPCSIGCLGKQQQQYSENAAVGNLRGLRQMVMSGRKRESSSGALSVTISGCDQLQLPISMSHLARCITPGHLAATVAAKALEESW